MDYLGKGEVLTNTDLSRAHTVRFFKSPLGLYLSDCTNMMIMSHYGISDVINVRLYDSQDELKSGARKKTCPDTSSDCELHYTRNRTVGYHEKYMNGGNTGVFKKNCVYQRSSTLLLGTHSPGKFISNRLQHTCLQFSSSLEELDWPLQVCLIRVVAKFFRIVGPQEQG